MTILFQNLLARLSKETRGQDLVEYALLAGFITIIVAAAFPPANSSISVIFSKVQSLLAQT